jgi:hypothetical protein
VRLNKLIISLASLICLLSISLLSCSVSTPVIPSGPNPPAIIPENNVPGYSFEVGTMTITPVEAQMGTPVRVDVPVKNTGSSKNAYVGTLYVDGQERGTQDITLLPGGNGTLTFQLARLDRGSHLLNVGNSQGTVRVYSVSRYTLTNSQAYLPQYTRAEYVPPPQLPYTSVDYFSPPVSPFFITDITFRMPFPEYFKILDAAGKELYTANTAYAETVTVPNIKVDGSFTVQMQTSLLTPDVRWTPFFGFNSWVLMVAYYWPEVSSVGGVQKQFNP